MDKTSFLEILDKNFSLEGFSFDTFVGVATEVLDAKEVYFKVLGRVVSGLGKKYGDNSVQKFADALEDTTGRKVSANTLRNYRWVYDRVGALDVPDDLPYKAWQILAASKTPEFWLNELKTNGWSAPELIREIMLASGKTPPVKLAICPNCLHEFEIKK